MKPIFDDILVFGVKKRNTDKLERVQRKATKLILKSDDPYDIRLKKLHLTSLEKRRSLADMTFSYKYSMATLILTSVKL